MPVMQSIYISYPALADSGHDQPSLRLFTATKTEHHPFGLREALARCESE